MPDQDTRQADPPRPEPSHPEPYLSNFGPLDGPILGRDCPGAMGVQVEGKLMPVGIAYPVGLVEHRRGPAQTFRLVIGKTELAGRWLCVGRRFVQLGEAEEEFQLAGLAPSSFPVFLGTPGENLLA